MSLPGKLTVVNGSVSFDGGTASLWVIDEWHELYIITLNWSSQEQEEGGGFLDLAWYGEQAQDEDFETLHERLDFGKEPIPIEKNSQRETAWIEAVRKAGVRLLRKPEAPEAAASTAQAAAHDYLQEYFDAIDDPQKDGLVFLQKYFVSVVSSDEYKGA